MKLMKILEAGKGLAQIKRDGKKWKPVNKDEAVWAIRFLSFIKAIDSDVKKNVAHYLQNNCKECDYYEDTVGNTINKVNVTRSSIIKDDYYLKEESRIKSMQEALDDYGKTLPKKETESHYYKAI